MKAIELIEADMRVQHQGPRRLAAFPIVIFLVMTAFGLGLRGDFVEAFAPSNVLPPLLIFFGLATFPWITRRLGLATLLFGAVLLLSLVQPQTPISLAKFDPPGSFWPETLHCLTLGLAASLVSSLLLTTLVFKLMPTPNRGVQVLCAILSGLVGLGALTLHCMGPLLTHTFLGHWGQGILVFPVAYGIQRAAFATRMKTIMGPSAHLKNLDRLGD